MYTQVQVHCRAEYQYPERPLRFMWEEREYSIDQVLHTWREPGIDCFLVVVAEGICELVYSRTDDRWILRQFTPMP